MATLYTLETANLGLDVPTRVTDVSHRGRVKVIVGTIPLASQQVGDIIVLGWRPAGSRYLFNLITSTVLLGGTTTLSIGSSADPTKYRSASIFNTFQDTPVFTGRTIAKAAVPLARDELMFVTIGGAALPASGTMIVECYYVES